MTRFKPYLPFFEKRKEKKNQNQNTVFFYQWKIFNCLGNTNVTHEYMSKFQCQWYAKLVSYLFLVQRP